MICVRTLFVISILAVVGTVCFGQSKQSKPPKKSHLSLTPGADFASLRAQDTNGTNVNFPDGVNLRVGAEFEFPIGKGKWSMIFEPTFQRYTAHGPYLLLYRSLETPLGLRRYFTVNYNTGFYINGAVVGDIPFRHAMELAPNVFFMSSGLKTNFAIGAGVAVRRFTIEYRHYTQRTRKDDTGSFTYNFNKRSVIFGFRLY